MEDEFSTLTVRELRKVLQKRRLSTYGRKPVLLARLRGEEEVRAARRCRTFTNRLLFFWLISSIAWWN